MRREFTKDAYIAGFGIEELRSVTGLRRLVAREAGKELASDRGERIPLRQ
jgi:hypothetical protein